MKPFVLPGTKPQFARDHSYNISHTKLELSFNFEDRAIEGAVIHDLDILQSLDQIEFDAADLKINRVQIALDNDPRDLVETSFRTDDEKKKIRISPGRTLSIGERIRIRIEYYAKPTIGLHFRGQSNSSGNKFVHAYTTGLLLEDPMFYFPCYNYPNMRMTSETLVTIPSHMVAIASGKLESVTNLPDGKSKMWHFKMGEGQTHVTGVLSVVVGEYEKLEDRFGTIPVEYYVPKGRENEARRSFQKTPKMMEFFSKMTGVAYPYAKYAQVVVSDFYNGGMEHVTSTTLTDETLHDERAELDFSSDDLVSHELAHQWFGDLISLKEWSHAWMNEAFATYFNALFREHDKGWDDFLHYLRSFVERLDEEVSKHYRRSIVNRYYVDSHELFDSHTYMKGAWVLQGIRGIVGDEVFWRVIRRYVKENHGKIVETSDFRKSLEMESGIDFERFFEEWLYSPGYPTYEASYFWSIEEKVAIVKITQTNANSDGVPLFSSPIEIRFELPGKNRITEKINMESKIQEFRFSLPSEPLNVSIDPSNWILKGLRFEKPLEMYLFQLRNDGENVIEKIRACEEISKHKESSKVFDSLLAIANSNSEFWGVRLEAAKSLGKIGTREALEKLSQLAQHQDHRVRRGAAEGLGGFPTSTQEVIELAIDLLTDLLGGDPSYKVRASSASSLGSYKNNAKARDTLRSAMSQDSYEDVVRSSTFKALSEVNDVESAGQILEYFLNGKLHQGRIAAVEALGRLRKSDDHFADELLIAQGFPDARVRAETASVIEAVGSERNLDSLRKWLNQEPEGRVRRRIREAIFSIESKSASPASQGTLMS